MFNYVSLCAIPCAMYLYQSVCLSVYKHSVHVLKLAAAAAVAMAVGSDTMLLTTKSLRHKHTYLVKLFGVAHLIKWWKKLKTHLLRRILISGARVIGMYNMVTWKPKMHFKPLTLKFAYCASAFATFSTSNMIFCEDLLKKIHAEHLAVKIASEKETWQNALRT